MNNLTYFCNDKTFFEDSQYRIVPDFKIFCPFFSNDTGFVASLDKACGKFINNNSVTKKANASSKSPELLAKYCDLLLKKSSRNPEEAELEDTLNQVVSAHICQKTEFRVRLFLTHHSGLEKS